MKIVDVQQGSQEWMKARAGIPTASEFDAILTPTLQPRKGQTVETYLAKKVAEAWLGGPIIGMSTWATEQGGLLEVEALPWYELEFGVDVKRIGLITSDNGRVACSPDGMVGEVGLEIKCPEPHTHTDYLMRGVLPPKYAPQVHGSLYVTGLQQWRFLSYRRHFPPLIVTVERDQEIMASIAEAVAGFLNRFDEAMARLEELNGGPAPRPGTLNEDPDWIKD